MQIKEITYLLLGESQENYEQNGSINKGIGNLERNQKEIPEQKSTTQMKNSLKEFKGTFEQAEKKKKESANFKIRQQKLSSREQKSKSLKKSREKKT